MPLFVRTTHRHDPLNQALIDAVMADDPEAVDTAIRNGALLDKNYRHGMTPLHLAAKENKLLAAQALLAQGANRSAQNLNTLIPLHLAAQLGHSKLVNCLLTEDTANLVTKSGNSALHYVAKIGDIKITKSLLAAGADINLINQEGLSPFQEAIISLQNDLVTHFMENGAELHLPASPSIGDTPLHTAAYANNCHAAELLFNKKVSLEAQNTQGLTPLHAAAAGISANTLEFLLENNAEIEARDNEGFTALHHAVELQSTECIDTLLEYSAEIEAKDHNGMTPALLAAQNNFRDVLIHLESKGADLLATNLSGENILAISCSNDRINIVWFLIDYPQLRRMTPNFNALLASNDNALLLLAIQRNHFELASYLLRIPNVIANIHVNDNIIMRHALNNRRHGIVAILRTIPSLRDYQPPSPTEELIVQQYETPIQYGYAENAMQAPTQHEQGALSNLRRDFASQLVTKGLKNVLIELSLFLETRYRRTPVIDLETDRHVEITEFPKDSPPILKALLQHPVHRAWRYLQSPNHFIAPHAELVIQHENNTATAAINSTELETLGMMWLAKKNESDIQALITTLAELCRGNNWRNQFDIRTRKMIEVDDQELDKPSCALGVNKRLLQCWLRFTAMKDYKVLTPAYFKQYFEENLIADNPKYPSNLYGRTKDLDRLTLESLRDAIQKSFTLETGEKLSTRERLLLKHFNISKKLQNTFLKQCERHFQSQWLATSVKPNEAQSYNSYTAYARALSEAPLEHCYPKIMTLINGLIDTKQLEMPALLFQGPVASRTRAKLKAAEATPHPDELRSPGSTLSC